MHKAEKLVDRVIPLLLLGFLALIAIETFFSKDAERFKHEIDIFDTALIGILAADLYFKYQRIKSVPKFIAKYWLQIMAVIPFFLVFRILESLQLTEWALTGTKFVNETRMIGRGPALIIREAEKSGEISRASQLLRFRPLARFPQLLKAVPFFEKATGKHHPHEKKKFSGNIFK